MTRVAVRLAKLEAAVPPRRDEPDYHLDLSRLTPAQKERMAEIQPRYLALGFAGLTDEEIDDLAEVAELLQAPESPEPAR